jgi:hypothetical protein
MRRIRPNASSLPAIVFLLILFAVSSAQAQSGRRLPKGSAPAPTPEPSTQPEKPQVAQTPAQPQISLLVISDISQSLYFSVPFPERVAGWVSKRLSDSSALAVAEGERANRGAAIKRAKASTQGFVIFLQVEENGTSPAITRNGRANLDDVSISYAVFAPVTGKAQSSGVVYLNQSSTIGIGQGRTIACYPGVRGNDYLLLRASLEVANRIMSVLNVPEPPLCR